MRITEYSAARLQLRAFPWGLAIGLTGVMAVPSLMAVGYLRAGMWLPAAVLAGIAALLLVGCFGVFVKRQVITLDRAAGQVTVEQRGLLGTTRKSFALQGLRGASVQATLMKDDPHRRDRVNGRLAKRRPDVRVFRPVLVWQSGRSEPLIEVYSNGPGAGIVAAAINGWMEGDTAPRRPVTLPESSAGA